jgi:hypothetical protein
LDAAEVNAVEDWGTGARKKGGSVASAAFLSIDCSRKYQATLNSTLVILRKSTICFALSRTRFAIPSARFYAEERY